jgi:hypothetical protein
LEFAVLAVCEWQKVELHYLLRRYLPPTRKCCTNYFNWRASRKWSAIPPTNQFVGFLAVFSMIGRSWTQRGVSV